MTVRFSLREVGIEIICLNGRALAGPYAYIIWFIWSGGFLQKALFTCEMRLCRDVAS